MEPEVEDATVNDTRDYEILFDSNLCSANVTSYMYGFIGLACLALASVILLIVSNCMQRGKLGKMFVEIISGFAVVQICYCLVNTLVVFLNQLGHCGWVHQADSLCKFLWWYKHVTFVSGNYLLVLISVCSKVLFVAGKTNSHRSLPIMIGFGSIILASAVFVIHYLIFTEVIKGKTQIASDPVFISFCYIGDGHTPILEIIEFCVGTVFPSLAALLSLIPHFLGAWTRFDNGIISFFKCTSQDKHDGRSKEVDAKQRLERYLFNFLVVAVAMHVFLLVPQRIFEFITLLTSRPYLAELLESGSEITSETWNTLAAMFTMFPLIYTIFMFPVYHSLAGNQGRCLTCFEFSKTDNQPLKRQQAQRHVTNQSPDVYSLSITSDEFASNF